MIRIKVALSKYWNRLRNLGNTVTVISPDGKPVQVNTAALQSSVAQNTTGILGRQNLKKRTIFQELSI